MSVYRGGAVPLRQVQVLATDRRPSVASSLRGPAFPPSEAPRSPNAASPSPASAALRPSRFVRAHARLVLSASVGRLCTGPVRGLTAGFRACRLHVVETFGHRTCVVGRPAHSADVFENAFQSGAPGDWAFSCSVLCCRSVFVAKVTCRRVPVVVSESRTMTAVFHRVCPSFVANDRAATESQLQQRVAAS